MNCSASVCSSRTYRVQLLQQTPLFLFTHYLLDVCFQFNIILCEVESACIFLFVCWRCISRENGEYALLLWELDYIYMYVCLFIFLVFDILCYLDVSKATTRGSFYHYRNYFIFLVFHIWFLQKRWCVVNVIVKTWHVISFPFFLFCVCVLLLGFLFHRQIYSVSDFHHFVATQARN